MKENLAGVNKMETMPIPRLIATMSVPPLISMFMQYSYNMVDCMFVAHINEQALSGVSLVFPVVTLMLATAIWMGVGVNVLVAQNLGRKDQETANHVVSSGLLLSATVGLLVSLLVMAIIRPFVGAFTDDPVIYNYAIEYMDVCLWMEIPCCVHLCIQKILQGTGNMIAPMWFQIAGVVFNFVFDPILIFGYFGFPAMGIRGAAVSTVGGYTLSMLLAFYVLIFRKQRVKIQTQGYRFRIGTIWNIFEVGFPSFVMNALGAFMTFFVNLFLVAYSMTAVAFFGAYFKIQQVVIMTLNGLIQGCVPIMSYCFGAKLDRRLLESFRWGTLASVLLTGVSVVVLWTFPAGILRFFEASEDMLSFGVPALRIMSVSYIFAGISSMIASLLQATRRIGLSLFINLLRQLLMLLPLMWLFSRIWAMDGIWWSFVAAEILTVLIGYVVYRKASLPLLQSRAAG